MKSGMHRKSITMDLEEYEFLIEKKDYSLRNLIFNELRIDPRKYSISTREGMIIEGRIYKTDEEIVDELKKREGI